MRDFVCIFLVFMGISEGEGDVFRRMFGISRDLMTGFWGCIRIYRNFRKGFQLDQQQQPTQQEWCLDLQHVGNSTEPNWMVPMMWKFPSEPWFLRVSFFLRRMGFDSVLHLEKNMKKHGDLASQQENCWDVRPQSLEDFNPKSWELMGVWEGDLWIERRI